MMDKMKRVSIVFNENDSLNDALIECSRVLNKSPFKNSDTIEVVFDKGFYRAVITNYGESRDKVTLAMEFHEPSYYIGCGNCEAEVVGKYCSECGARLIYESEGE